MPATSALRPSLAPTTLTVRTVRLTGDLGSAGVEDLLAAEAALRAAAAGNLAVDLTAVESFGSGLIRVLLEVRRDLAASGWSLAVSGDRHGVLAAAGVAALLAADAD